MVGPDEFRSISRGKLRGKMKTRVPKNKCGKGKLCPPKQGPMPRLANNPAYTI